MSGSRASDSERAYWRRLGEASDQLAGDETPPLSISEVFARMERIRRRLGRLAEPGFPSDEEAAIAELVAIRERFLRKGRHSRS